MDSAAGSHADREELIQELNRNYGLDLAGHLSAAELEALLAERLNRLISADFNAVVTILYRVDVNEAKLKELLRTGAGEDAGRIMARLIIERQQQKIKTRSPGPLKGESEWMDL